MRVHGAPQRRGDILYVHYDRSQAILVRSSPRAPWNEIKRVNKLKKPAGTWHEGKVTCSGDTLRVYLNGKLLYEAKHTGLKAGRIGFYASQGRVHIKDIVVGGRSRRPATAFTLPPRPAHILDVRRIWNEARHNGFTDLVRGALEAAGHESATSTATLFDQNLTAGQQSIVDALREADGHVIVEILAAKTQLPLSQVQADLTLLQIRGNVHRDHQGIRLKR